MGYFGYSHGYSNKCSQWRRRYVPFGKPLAPFERWIPRLKPARKIAHTLRVLTWNICGTPGVSKVRARVQPNALRMRLSAAATP